MKRIISSFIIFGMLASNCAIAEPLKGSAIINDVVQEQDNLYTGAVETLDRKEVINMTVSQVLDSSVSVEGDEFFAEVTTDVYSNKGLIIPKGTVAHGKITENVASKRLGKSATLSLAFDYLITPDGREIPIEGSMTTKLHPVAEGAKIVAQDVGYTLAGGAVGGFVALNWLGIEAAIASHGYTLIGGAAIGGTIGLGMALIRKGNDVLIAPGDQIKVKIAAPLNLPVYKEDSFKQEELFYDGLNISINDIKYQKDPFGEANTITLNILISNMSDKTLSGFEMALVNDYNVKFSPSIFGDTKLMFKQIKPGDKLIGEVSFAVDNIHRNFWLTFYERRTGKPITKISVDNAYKNISDRSKKRNQRVHNSKMRANYKKDKSHIDLDLF